MHSDTVSSKDTTSRGMWCVCWSLVTSILYSLKNFVTLWESIRVWNYPITINNEKKKKLEKMLDSGQPRTVILKRRESESALLLCQLSACEAIWQLQSKQRYPNRIQKSWVERNWEFERLRLLKLQDPKGGRYTKKSSRYLYRRLSVQLNSNLCMLRVKPHDTKQNFKEKNDYWGAISQFPDLLMDLKLFELPLVRGNRETYMSS